MSAQEDAAVPLTALGQALEERRGRLGMSKSALVKQAGVSMATYNRMISNPTQTPQWRVVVKTGLAVGLPGREALELAGMTVAPPGARRVVTTEELEEFLAS